MRCNHIWTSLPPKRASHFTLHLRPKTQRQQLCGTALVMQHHAQYAMHSGVYRPSPSPPVGLLNPSGNLVAPHPLRPHTISTSTVAVPVAPESGASSGMRDGLGRGEIMTGAAGYAHWDTVDRRQQQHRALPPGQQYDRHFAQVFRPLGAEADGGAEQPRVRASPSLHSSAAALVPPPPPLLGAAQREHLRQLQIQQQCGGSGSVGTPRPGDDGQQNTMRNYVLPSPSRHAMQLPELKHSPRQQEGFWPSGQQHYLLPMPRYANAMPVGASPCPSPVVKVPIYSTLSEAIEHQQKFQLQQQQQLQHAYPATLPPPPQLPPTPTPTPPVGVTPVHGAAAHFFEAPATPGCRSPRMMMAGIRQPQQRQQHGFNDNARRAAEEYSRHQHHHQQHQHQQHQLVLQRYHSLQADEERGEGAAAASHRLEMAPPHRSFPVATATPLQALPSQGPMQAPPPPLAPPLGLRLQTCGLASAPISAPATPVMVYAQGHGYMMAYPPINVQNVQTPISARSQAPKAWDPYECVSPSGESTHAGFGRRGQDLRALSASAESSPAALSSTMSVSSRGSMSKPDGDDDTSQGQRSRASSVLSDAIERGFNDDNSQRNVGRQCLAVEASRLLQLQGKAKIFEKEALKTPSRARKSPVSSAGGASGGGDKENTPVRGGVAGGQKKREGKASEADEQLAGQKRGGRDVELEKQKTFTGSYFQVSPGSFLQSSKRQRNFA